MGLLETADWTGKIFSGGWVSADGGTLTSTEPATGQVLAEVGLAGQEDVSKAAEQARAAQPAWAATPGHERAALIGGPPGPWRTTGRIRDLARPRRRSHPGQSRLRSRPRPR